jgi:RND superfamily putative drug exporter
VLSFALGGNVAGLLKPAGFTDPGSESSVAVESAADALGYDPQPGIVVIAESPGGAIDSPAARAEIRAVAEQLAADPEIARVLTPFDPDRGGLISEDGSSALIVANFEETDPGLLEEAAERIPEELQANVLELSVGGSAVAFNDVNSQVEEDLIRAELIAFPILALLLVIIFRGLVAASLPLMIGGIAVAGTFLSLRLLTEFADISIFALNITTALGLGLAVDYGLLLTSRYREELERHGPGWEAHRRTVESAGRAVFFSGLTVAAATASLIILPQRFLYSMGAGAAIVSLLAASAALLATPAMLALLGERVNALGVRRRKPSAGTGRWYGLAKAVMRRPARVAVVVVLALAVLAAPLARATLTQPGTDAVPDDRQSRQVSERLSAEFTPNLDSPIGVSVPEQAASRVAAEAADLPGALAVSRPTPLGDSGRAYIEVTPATDPLSPAAQDTVTELRQISEAAGAGAVSGTTAEFIDFKQSLLDNAPKVALLIAGSTMLLLFLLTGSLILPVKTLILNLLSIAAAIGIVILVFQEGFGAGLFGYDGPAALETALVVVLGATTFGLATDYAVLVLARIKEFHDVGHRNEEAVALGIDRTGRVISAAALLLAVVFLAFTTGEIFFMKQVGLGQAVAVAIDATIVRALLVPALMGMLGEWSWWAPRPLRALYRRLGLAEPSLELAVAGPGAQPVAEALLSGSSTGNRAEPVDQALVETERRLQRIELRAERAQERAARAERLADLRGQEADRPARLQKLAERTSEAEVRLRDADRRARDAAEEASTG